MASTDETKKYKHIYSCINSTEILAEFNGVSEIEVKFSQTDENIALLYVKFIRNLMLLEYNVVHRSTRVIDVVYEVFESDTYNSLHPWYVAETGVVVIRKHKKTCFFRRVANKLEPFVTCSTDNGYDRVLMGKFLKDDSVVDILVQNDKTISFSSIFYNHASYSTITVLANELMIDNIEDISLSDSFDGAKGNIILINTGKALQIFKTTDRGKFEQIASCESITSPHKSSFEKILFAKLSNSPNKHMLHFNSTGLTVYRYDKTSRTFNYIYYTTEFSEHRFWKFTHINSLIAQDMNADGIDELVGTGPSGLQIFRAVSSESELYLEIVALKTANNVQRFAYLKNIIFATANQPLNLISSYGDKLYVNEVQNKTEEIISFEVKEQQKHTQSTLPLIAPVTKYTRWIHEQLDITELLQPLNPLSGKIQISIPLIQVDNPFGINVRKVFQYGEGVQQNVLGEGWSFPLDYITVDRRGSIFEEYFRYKYVTQNNELLLAPFDYNPESKCTTFKIPGRDGLLFKFYNNDHRWEAENSESSATFYFGRHKDKEVIQHAMDGDKKLFPLKWYLINEMHTSGSFVNYDYIMPTKERVQLRKLVIDTGSSVVFNYVENRMESFIVNTTNYEQTIALSYVALPNQSGLFLASIKQKEHVVFDFQYDPAYKLLTNVVYPNGLETKLEYNNVQIDRNTLQTSIESNITNFRLFSGPDYNLLIDLLPDGTQLRVRVLDIAGGSHSRKATNEILLSNQQTVVAYHGFVLANLFGILSVHNEVKMLYVYNFNDSHWMQTVHSLHVSATVAVSNHIMYILSDRSFSRAYVNDRGVLQTQKHIETVTQHFVFNTIPHGLLTYDDRSIHMRVEISDKLRFVYEIEADAGLIQKLDTVINQFALDAKSRTELVQGLKLDMLQFYNNIVVLRTLELRNDDLVVRLMFRMLDNNHRTVYKDNWRINLGPVLKFELEVDSGRGNKCQLGYEKYNQKFVRVLRKCYGPRFSEMKMNFDANIAYIEYSNMSLQEKKSLILSISKKYYEQLNIYYTEVRSAYPFAFNIAQLGISVNEGGIYTCGKILSFNGEKWSLNDQQRKVSVALGDEYKLEKLDNSEDSYKIYLDNKLMFNSNTTDASKIRLIWPQYFAVQAVNETIRIYLFPSNETLELPKHENMSHASNNLLLVTTNNKEGKLIFRSVKGLIEPKVRLISNQTLFLSEQEHRITSYEYSTHNIIDSEYGLIFNSTKTLPGNNASKLGWYESNFNAVTRETLVRAYDGSGHFVMAIEQEEERKTEKPNINSLITDISGQHVIVDVSPLNVTKQEFLYYGFEKYERTHVGDKHIWKYSDSQIVTSNGNRFLRIGINNSYDVSALNIGTPHIPYLFSCWMRTKGLTSVGDTTDLVSITLTSTSNKIKTLNNAVVKQKIQDWFYIELTIPESSSNETMIAKVSITTSNDSLVEIDNIRFSPMDVNFKARIFKTAFPEASSILRNNGLLTQFLQSTAGHRVGLLSEEGSVRHFVTYSKLYLLRIYNILPQVTEVRPTSGIYETLDESFFNRWISDNFDQWKITSGNLMHISETTHTVTRNLEVNSEVTMIRFYFNLDSTEATIQMVLDNCSFDILLPISTCGNAENCQTTAKILKDGEILVLFSRKHRAVWVEGVLVHEVAIITENIKTFGLTVTGKITISEMMFLYDPSVTVTYYNLLGLPLQTLVMQDPMHVRIQEIVYDEIDRPVIVTKWTTVALMDHKMFSYREDFIIEVKSDGLSGQVDRNNADCEGFPYYRKKYGNNPTSAVMSLSLPGKVFAEDEQHSRHFDVMSNEALLDLLFPPVDGYNQEVETLQNVTRVTVKDSKNNKVAYYVRVHDFDHRLSTFQYENNNLVLNLPPIYHVLAGTFSRREPLWNGNLSEEERDLQAAWGTAYSYDDRNRMITKRTPDSGVEHYVYNEEHVLRLLIHMHDSQIDKIVYFSYSPTGKIVKEAIVQLTESEIKHFIGNRTQSPGSTNYVEYYHGEYDSSPSVRHRSQQSVRHIDSKQMIESLMFDENDQILKKIHVVPTLNTTYSVDFEYNNDKLGMIRYPIEVNETRFTVIFKYNNAGDMINIGTPSNSMQFADIRYTADGLVSEIEFEPQSKHSYRRHFVYNEPGYLTTISDSFLNESISYLKSDGCYNPYALMSAGLISKTSFNALWHPKSNPSLSSYCIGNFIAAGINETTVEFCLRSLQRNAYLDKQHRPLQSYYTEIDDTVADACKTNRFRELFHTEGFPSTYGHLYDYDGYQQLVEAKYFQNKAEMPLKPLTISSFAKMIPGFSAKSSEQVWQILVDNSYIERICINPGICSGKPKKSLLNDFVPSIKSVRTLIMNAIANRRTIDAVRFKEKCAAWSQYSESSYNCAKLWKNLLAHNIVGAHSKQTLNALDLTLRTVIASFSDYLPEIVGVLHQHFATELGHSPGDILSSSFDANGNHELFYMGFNRYRFTYKKGTNQIDTIVKNQLNSVGDEHSFRMEHNSEGSVTVALHKGINQIEYDLLSNRPSSISMTDGRKVLFQYDVRGERTFKQVLDQTGKIYKEKYYIRDLNGRVLIDIQLTYITDEHAPDVQITSFIYSSTGLIGFVRNNQFYSVFTDHEGSVRLIIKEHNVEAAYDYLPYGHIFRKSEENLDSGISYLYTGQEWDEETGLYNYHSRLYDPEIGRFYQIDPKGQYSSPYIYAGNSPVVYVDPDGQLATLIISILLGILGAYLGGAAANKSWNPAKWNWRSADTWLGIIGGAVLGYSIPFSMGSTLKYLISLGITMNTSLSIMIGTGIGFSYFSIAAANNEWDPAKWDMTSPSTWNALFTGIAMTGIITNPDSLIQLYGGISTQVGKGMFVTGKLVLSGSLAYMFMVMENDGEFDPSKWNYSKPGVYFSFLGGLTTATSVIKLTTNLPKTVVKWLKNINTLLDSIDGMDAYLKYNSYVGMKWSEQFSNVQYYLKTNPEFLRLMGRNVVTLSFFTMVTSLRMARSVEKSEIPEFSIMTNFIKSITATKGFSDKIVDKMIPVIEDTSRMHSPTVSSCASRIFDTMFKVFKSWNLGNFKTKIGDRSVSQYSTQRNATPLNKSYAISNCYQFESSEADRSFIKCFGHHEVLSIYPTLENFTITEDHFHQCFPLSFKNVASVSCQGKNSSLLFSGYDVPRLVDLVDGWLLLVRIIPAIYRNIVDGFRLVVGSKAETKNQEISYNDCSHLLYQLQHVRSFISIVSERVTWAKPAFDDLEEDVNEFLLSSKRNWSNFRDLNERFTALREDISEELSYINAFITPELCALNRIDSIWFRPNTAHNINLISKLNEHGQVLQY